MEAKFILQIILHVLIGILFKSFTGLFPRIYFFAIILYFLFTIIFATREAKTLEVLKACAYIVGIEVLLRMTNGAVFYEASKYLVILFVMMGMFYNGISGKGYPYFLYLILLVPSIIVASLYIGFDANFRTNIAFVLSGPVCLGVSALYCIDKEVTKRQIIEVVKQLSLPIISVTTYLFLYSPSIKDTLTGTQSNFEASGGFGPNQVSTILGLGMFSFCVFIFLYSKNKLATAINIIILSAISFRAIITFSRGGVFTAILMIVAFLFVLYFQSKAIGKNRILLSLISLVGILSITWMISSSQTNGLIDKRYSNEDKLGRKKEDVSAGRVDLFMGELEGFVYNPFVGVGANGMKEKRIEKLGRGIASHSELSRILSEHGLIGVVIIIILVITPLSYRTTNKGNIFFYAFLVFWFATINHSSMRIAAPGFVYALALLNIKYEKRPIHRKRLVQKR